MTQETFNKIKALEKDLKIMAVDGYVPVSADGTLRQLEVLQKEYNPQSRLVDWGCRACVESLIKDVWNNYNLNKNKYEK